MIPRTYSRPVIADLDHNIFKNMKEQNGEIETV